MEAFETIVTRCEARTDETFAKDNKVLILINNSGNYMVCIASTT
jgi:hypothetical protein